MTPHILEGMKFKFDVDKANQHDYTWVDLGVMNFLDFEDSRWWEARSAVPEIFNSSVPPEDVPMPFEKLAIVAVSTADDKDPMDRIIVMTFERTENGTCLLAIPRGRDGHIVQLLQDGTRTKKGELDFTYWGNPDTWRQTLDGIRKVKNLPPLEAKAVLELGEHAESDRFAFSLQGLAKSLYTELLYRLTQRKQTVAAHQAIPNPANAKRISKGKKPLFEWKVIDVTARLVDPPSTPTGRTHASPRRHKRIGHLRRYKSGKTVWIKEMMVGKIEFGYIHHSYTTNGGAHATL